MKTEKTLKGFLAVLLCLCLTVGVPASGYVEETWEGTVYGGWLILRDAPSYDGNVRSSYPTGTVVTIRGQYGAWYAVTAPDGLKGYMLGKYLTVSKSGSKSEGGSAESIPGWVVSGNGKNVRLRSGPGTGYSVIASYAPGTECRILESGKTWSLISIGKRTGYMMSRYLSTNPPASRQQDSTQKASVPTYAFVYSRNGKKVNLRSGPGLEYGIIASCRVGTPLTIMVRGLEWDYVRVGNTYGYMMRQFILEGGTPATMTDLQK